MIDVAAGLAVAGKIAFTGSFAVFATGRAYDQIRNTVCYADLNVKLTPTHAGITVGPDGGSHQMIEDLALMRVLPGMRVLVPADYHSAKAAIRVAAADARAVLRAPGPRDAARGLPRRASSSRSAGPTCCAQGTDVTIVACGVMVAEALAAADILAADGISAEVIDVATRSSRSTRTRILRERAQDRRRRHVRGAQHHRRSRLGGRRGARRACARARWSASACATSSALRANPTS